LLAEATFKSLDRGLSTNEAFTLSWFVGYFNLWVPLLAVLLRVAKMPPNDVEQSDSIKIFILS